MRNVSTAGFLALLLVLTYRLTADCKVRIKPPGGVSLWRANLLLLRLDVPIVDVFEKEREMPRDQHTVDVE